MNLGDAVGFVLRQANGRPQLTLDFGARLSAAPGGLQPKQLVTVVGTLVTGA